ncbi:MAG: GNAT family N-acetyltransferase [Candidatus Dormibacteria bacterium]
MTTLQADREREGGPVRLIPWGVDDLPLLELLVGDPAMMAHLGGPEALSRIAERQRRYQTAGSRQFKILFGHRREGVGWVGYWERSWGGEQVYEMGWAVVPAFQGRGIASKAAAQVVARARLERRRIAIHAFPAVENLASNAVCRRLGFTLVGQPALEYPIGNLMTCNDWRLAARPGELDSSR